MKKLIAFLLAATMMFALAACGGGEGADGFNDYSGEGKTFTEKTVVKMMVPSSPSWPVREDWKVFEYMQEGTGAALDLMIIPAEDVATKLPLMMSAPEDVPDILAGSSNKSYNQFWGQGTIALEDVAEHMPNYNAWLASLTEEEYSVAVANRKHSDGKIYYTPGSGREGRTRMHAWLYREDIFEKHGLKAPTTFDELYQVCKKLKILYPDSYPFCTRSSYLFDIPGSSFDKWWEHDIYYDFEEEEWKWGAMEPAAKEAVEFYKKMIQEGLMPAETLTLDNVKWEEYILTNRGFIMPHLQLRIDFFNTRAQVNNPEFKIVAIKPPVANAENGVPKVDRADIEQIGFVIGDTRDEKKITNAAKFIDWLYSDEGVELVSWGKEGETFEWTDKEAGERKFITDENNSQPNTLYGFQLYGTFARLDPTAAKAVQSETTLECEDVVLEGTLPYHNPAEWVAFNAEEQKIIDEKYIAIYNYTQEMLTKFMLDQEPMSKYDDFINELKKMGVEELIAAYASAYDRVK